MTDDDRIKLTRRKILASASAVGLAGAGAGLGTSAFFSDTESFGNNSLTAGTLDLKVDWQQTYYGAMETNVPVNAYPDHDGDGLQSIDDDTEYVLDNEDGENVPIEMSCDDLESGDQLPEGVYSSPNRSEGNGGSLDQDSLVALSDVKPGDQGEITFSLHLCDNPGYVWLTADDFEQTGGNTTEPEEAELEGDEEDDGELGENTYIEIWYDEDCDNKLDTSGEEGQDLEVALVSDVSGSMEGSISDLQSAATSFVNQLTTPDEGAAVSFSDGANLDQELTTDYGALNSAINDYSADGSTDMDDGIITAENELLNGTNATSGANKVMIVLSDGEPSAEEDAETAANNAKDEGIRIFTIALGTGPDEDFMEGIASNDDDAYTAAESEDLQEIYNEIATEVITGEQVILGEGDGVHDNPVSVAQAMEIMDNNDGMVPLDGDGDMEYDDGATSEARDCFDAGTQHCIGVRWWVPTDVGNVIQDDTMSFDLGFYAEQCRHNDGAGMIDADETTPSEPEVVTDDA